MEESSATDAHEAKAMLKSLHFRPSISNNGGKQKTNAPEKKSQQPFMSQLKCSGATCKILPDLSFSGIGSARRNGERPIADVVHDS
jgi:hypothetical protein